MTITDLVGEMRQSDVYGRAFEGSGHSGSGPQPHVSRCPTIAARKAEYLAYRYGPTNPAGIQTYWMHETPGGVRAPQVEDEPHPVQHLSPDELRLRLYAKHGRTEALPAMPPTREHYKDQLEAVRCALIEAVYA